MNKQRLRVLNKLMDHGFDTEKKIIGLSIREILSMDDISKADMLVLAELQNAIRKHKTVSFLSNGSDEVSVKEKGETDDDKAESSFEYWSD